MTKYVVTLRRVQFASVEVEADDDGGARLEALKLADLDTDHRACIEDHWETNELYTVQVELA